MYNIKDSINRRLATDDQQPFQVECFMSFMGEEIGFYDFKAKNLEMGLDLLVAMGYRMNEYTLEVSITIGCLNFSRQASSPEKLERVLKDATNIFNWEIVSNG